MVLRIYRLVSTIRCPSFHSAQLIVLSLGGGIVFDSDPYDEWMETMNKLAANIHCIIGAEERFDSPEDNPKDLAVGQDPQGGSPIHMGDGS
jgi:anthranilate synthase component 1